MLLKTLFISTTLIIFSQLVLGDEDGRTVKAVCSTFVNIAGREYCLDMESLYQDEAQALCQNTNMTLVAFDSADDKYDQVFNWLFDNGYTEFVFWTSGFRNVGLFTWMWETTFAPITEFHWASENPRLDGDLINRMCIGLSTYDNSGWIDSQCSGNFVFKTLCEHFP